MKPFLTLAGAEEILSQLPSLRQCYGSDTASSEQRAVAALDLVEGYGRLHLFDRAIDWLEALSPPSEDEWGPWLVRRYYLVAASAWLDRQEAVVAARYLEKVRGLDLSLDQERSLLALTVRHSLLFQSADSFAPLERAFRHLRHHPDARWLARFLLWRAQWQVSQTRTEEAQATLKKALTEAEGVGALDLQLEAWLALATLPGLGRTKAVRAARTALAKAQSGDIPAAEAEALRVLSELTSSPKETESSRLFRNYFTGLRALEQRLARWDRLSGDEDRKVLEAADQDRRRRDADLLASIVGRLAHHPDLSRSLDDLYQPLRRLMAADVFGIALWVAEQNVLDYALFMEEGLRTRVGLIPVDSERSLGAWCFRTRKSVRINDIDKEYSGYLKELSRLADHRPKSMLFQPLVFEDQPLGIITVQAFSRDAYGPEAESQLAVIASCVSLRLQVGPRSPI